MSSLLKDKILSRTLCVVFQQHKCIPDFPDIIKLLFCFIFCCLKMEKVEEDLLRSKSLRQNQAKEFSQQLDALRQKYEQQVCMIL